VFLMKDASWARRSSGWRRKVAAAAALLGAQLLAPRVSRRLFGLRRLHLAFAVSSTDASVAQCASRLRGCAWSGFARLEHSTNSAKSFSRNGSKRVAAVAEWAAQSQQPAAEANLVPILLISCLNLMSATLVAPITPSLLKLFELDSVANLGLISSFFALGRFCTTSFWPVVSDYIGRRRVLVIAMLGGAVSTTLQGIAVQYKLPFGAFLFARSLAGTFSGVVPVLKACIVDSFPSSEVPKVLAYREAAGTLAFVLGPTIGGCLASWWIVSPLYISAVGSLAAALLAAYKIRETVPRRATAGRRNPQQPNKTRWGVATFVAPLLLLSFVWACTRTCFHTYYPMMLSNRYGLPPLQMGTMMTSVSLLVSLVQVFGFEPCRKRIGLTNTLALGGSFAAVGLIGVGSAPTNTPVASFFLLSGLYSVGVALLSPAMPALLVRAAPGHIGATLGIESLCVNFGRIVAPPIFGLYAKYGASQATGVATFIATIIVFLSARRRKSLSQAAA